MKAALEWQVSLGIDEAIADEPVDRFSASEALTAPKPATQPVELEQSASTPDAVAIARSAASSAEDLEALKEAMSAFDLCDLKRGAKKLVFSDGRPGARVMIVGEAPGRDEDLAGLPFVGRAGQLLDLMFSHIGLGRTNPDVQSALYITNVLPWRPPQNRDPKPEEVAMMLPFLERHISLAAPDVIVAMGNHATGALLKRTGITRLRGNWSEAFGRPVLPMFHPAYLLRSPAAKREAWADLLALRAHLDKSGVSA